jgi:RHS repeat-associated protein
LGRRLVLAGWLWISGLQGRQLQASKQLEDISNSRQLSISDNAGRAANCDESARQTTASQRSVATASSAADRTIDVSATSPVDLGHGPLDVNPFAPLTDVFATDPFGHSHAADGDAGGSGSSTLTNPSGEFGGSAGGGGSAAGRGGEASTGELYAPNGNAGSLNYGFPQYPANSSAYPASSPASVKTTPPVVATHLPAMTANSSVGHSFGGATSAIVSSSSHSTGQSSIQRQSSGLTPAAHQGLVLPNPQRTTSGSAQPLASIHWSTPLDLQPQRTSGSLLVHYGAPVFPTANTMVIPVKAGDGYDVMGLSTSDGTLKWTIPASSIGYVIPNHNWTPSYNVAVGLGGRVYFPGPGGTVFYKDNVDQYYGKTKPDGQLAFYGLANYSANPSDYNKSLFINTPLTVDSAGDVFCGFRVQASPPVSFGGSQGGYARLGADGNNLYASAQSIAGGDTNISEDAQNSAPALGGDGRLYVVVRSAKSACDGYLAALDSTTLSVKTVANGQPERVFLRDPRNGIPAGVSDDSSASPVVAQQDGSVFLGVQANPFNGARGWLLHFSPDLQRAFAPGAFGWDSTPALVPASFVSQYSGQSSYLVVTQYNNAAGANDGDWGDGVNRLAILDPGSTQLETHVSSNGLLVMKEVASIQNPSLDNVTAGMNPAARNARHQWFTSSPAVDLATRSVFATAEDGMLYRWDLGNDTLSQAIRLTAGVGEASTPTTVGPDGTVFAIQDGTLYAIGSQPGVNITLISSQDYSTYGQQVTFTVTVSAAGSNTATPTGKVSFKDGSSTLGSSTLDSSGNATYITPSGTTLAQGDHFISAVYSGDAHFSAGTMTLIQTVKVGTTATVASSANPAVLGQTVTFTATIAPDSPGTIEPVGLVSFLDGTETLGQGILNGSGQATFSISTLSGGIHAISVVFGGDSMNDASASAALAQTIVRDATVTTVASSLNPSTLTQPVTFTANVRAVSPGTAIPTGTVTFWDGDSTLGTAGLTAGSGTLTVPLLPTGTHAITVSYSGDSCCNSGSSTALLQTVSTLSSSVVLTSSVNPSVFGQAVTLTANVSAAVVSVGTPTGTVTFYDEGSTLGTANLSAGMAACPDPLPVLELHFITATYNGDANYATASTTIIQTVNKDSTSISLSSSANPSVVAQSVFFTATVSADAPGTGTPTGTVIFEDAGTTLGIVNVDNIGQATFRTSSLAIGVHTITASYGGDSYFLSSTSSALGQTVNQVSSSVAVSSSLNPSTFGQTITLSTTVSAVSPGTGTPTGSVVFLDGITTLSASELDGNGLATYTTNAISAGVRSITVAYSGDTNFASSTSDIFLQTVNQATTATSLTASPDTTVFSESITFTAIVSVRAPGGGTPTGDVAFIDGDNTLGTGPVGPSGIATFVTPLLSAGTHMITAIYEGDANFTSSSSSAVTHTVSMAGTYTIVSSSINPSLIDTPFTLTATVSAVYPAPGIPDGSVLFVDTFGNATRTLGTQSLDGNGQAFIQVPFLAKGEHTLTAIYSGSSNFNPSISLPFTQTANLYTSTTSLASSVNPSVAGQALTLTATVGGNALQPNPTGVVTFLEGATTLGTGTLNELERATLTIAFATAMTHSISALYGGDAIYYGSTSPPFSQTVNKADTAVLLTSSVDPSVFGQAVTFTATVTAVAPGAGIATGTVAFLDGSVTLGTGNVSSGSASFTTSGMSRGDHSIVALYLGDMNFNSNESGPVIQSVDPASSVVTLSASPDPTVFGQPVTFTATVTAASPSTATPTGSVAFLDGDGTLGTSSITTSSHHAAFTATTLSAAEHTITAIYLSDGNFAGSASGSVTQTVNQASTSVALASSPVPAYLEQSVTITATVTSVGPGSGTPDGTVTFLEGTATLGTGTLSDGTATYTSSSFSAGVHTITASYAGSSNYSANSSIFYQTINLYPSTTSLCSSLNPSYFGQSETFTVSMTGQQNPLEGTPTGTITFLDASATLGTINLDTSGSAAYTTAALAGGTHTITAVYSGDSVFATSSGFVLQTVNAAITSTALSSLLNPSIYNQEVIFEATVTAQTGGTPSGSVTFFDAATSLSTQPLSAAGVAVYTTTALAVGTHAITAVYGGTGNFALSASAVLTQTVNLTATSTTLSSNHNPSVYGQPVTFFAPVIIVSNGHKLNSTESSTGTVTFYDGSTVLGTSDLPDAEFPNSSAFYVTATLSVGTHTITAVFSGDANYASSVSGVLTQTVIQANTTTAISSSLNASSYGVSVSFTATVTPVSPSTAGAPPAGTVMFKDGSTTVATASLSGSIATFTTSTLAIGSHTLTAAYLGDANYNSSASAALTQTVNPAVTSTTLASAINPSTYGQNVQFSATVTSAIAGTPTGTVSFYDANHFLGSITVTGSGAVSIGVSALAAGTNTITAAYSGDANFASSTSAAVVLIVDAASTSTALTTSVNPSDLTQSVTFSATVTSAFAMPAGNVRFMDGSVTLATAGLDGSGNATYTTTSLSGGTHSISAVYVGTSNFISSGSDTLSQTVNRASTTTTLSASIYSSQVGQPATFTVVVSPAIAGLATPTGFVEFDCDSVSVGNAAVNASGVANFTTSSLALGAHTITAVYSGDTNFASTTSAAITHIEAPYSSSTAVTSSVNPAVWGQSITFTATVTSGSSGTPSGTVTFLDGTATLGTGNLDASAQAFYTSASLPVGSHTITAQYAGDTNFAGSTSSGLTQTVNQGATSTALSSSLDPSNFSAAVTFTATVSAVSPAAGTATGTVTFRDGTATLGTAALNSSGQASFSISTLSIANHTITAVYGGDANFTSSTSPALTQTVNEAISTTALTVSVNPSVFGQSVVLTAVVTSSASPTPTGTITFLDAGTKTLGTATLSGGKATLSYASFSVNNHTVTASYGGDANFLSSVSAAVTQTVNKSATSTALSSNNNPSDSGTNVSFTATVTATAPGAGTPTGTVTFLDGTKSLTNITINSQAKAVYTTSSLSIGTHTITAKYNGDGNFTTSTSAVLLQSVVNGGQIRSTPTTSPLPTPTKGTGGNGNSTPPAGPRLGPLVSYYVQMTGIDFTVPEGTPYYGPLATLSAPLPQGPQGYFWYWSAIVDPFTPWSHNADLGIGPDGITVYGGGVGLNFPEETSQPHIIWILVSLRQFGGIAPSGLGGGGAVAHATVTDVVPVLTAIPVTALEGADMVLFVAYIADVITQNAIVDIEWGDGSRSWGRIGTAPDGRLAVSGTHVYEEDGKYTIKATVRDYDGGGADVSTTATVHEGILLQESFAPIEGQEYNGPVGQVVHLDEFAETEDDSTVTIDWGDGDTSDGKLEEVPGFTGEESIVGSHTYAEEGSERVVIKLIGDGGDEIETLPYTIEVKDPNLVPTNLRVTTSPLTALKGVDANLALGAILDDNPDDRNSDFQATIDWGDGSTDNAVVSGFAIRGHHAFSDIGAWPVTVTVSLDDGRTAKATTTIVVKDAPVTGRGASLVATPDGLEDAVLANFTDPNLLDTSDMFTAMVNWGDGSEPESATVDGDTGVFEVGGSHTYSSMGEYTASVSIYEDGMWAAAVMAPISVIDDQIFETPLSGTVQRVMVEESGGVARGSVVANIFDPEHELAARIDCLSAIINWGDESPTSAGHVGAVSNSLLRITSNDRHVYPEEGGYPLTVVLFDDMQPLLTLHGTASVGDPNLGKLPPLILTAAKVQELDNVAVAGFVDAHQTDQAGQYTATIDWGDGSGTDTGTVVGTAGYYWVTGSHSYDTAGTYSIWVRVADDQGQGAAATDIISTAKIGTLTQGVLANITTANFIDPDPFDAADEDYSAEINWGDGTTVDDGTISEGDTTPAQGASFKVEKSHKYLTPGQKSILTVIDHESTTADDLGTFTILPVLVADASLVPAESQPDKITANEGDLLIDEVALVAFDDDNPTCSAQVNWGDGTALQYGTVKPGDSGEWIVYGPRHSYTEGGTYTITVLVQAANGANIVETNEADITDPPLTSQGQDIQVMGHDTGQVTVATFTDADTTAPQSEYQAIIDWGDGNTSVGKIIPNQDQSYGVMGQHAYADNGSYTIAVVVRDAGGAQTDPTSSTATVMPEMISGGVRTNDPEQADLLPIGEATVALNTGGLRLSHELDFDQSPGTSVGGDPALEYNSNTVAPQPIVELRVSDGNLPGQLAQVQVQLTWDDNAPQGWVTYNVTGDHNEGEPFVFAVQVGNQATVSGMYQWSAHVRLIFADGTTPIDAVVSGTTPVVVRDQFADQQSQNPISPEPVPVGAGWGIGGIDQLVSSCGSGVMWETGTGDARYFAQDEDGNFISPTNDFGHLEQMGDGSFQYTAKDRTQWIFNDKGLLTSVQSPDETSINYFYDDEERLEAVEAPDGSRTEFNYDQTTGLLNSIEEPGGRTLTLYHDGTDLQQIIDVDNTSRYFSYMSHQLTEDSWDPLATQFTYASGMLSETGSYSITPAAQQALSKVVDGSAVFTKVVDGLSNETDYSLDGLGRELELKRADTMTESWQRDEHGQVTRFEDFRHLTTNYQYDYGPEGAGDLIHEDRPDLSFDKYEYDPRFHMVMRDDQSFDATQDAITFDYYNANAEPSLSIDAVGNPVSNDWSQGLLMSTTDLMGSTDYRYDEFRRLTATIDPLQNMTTETYDPNGNPQSERQPIVDGVIKTTQFTYTPRNRLVVEVSPANETQAWSYDAYGDLTAVMNGRGFFTVYDYDSRGFRTDMIQAYGTDQAIRTQYQPDADGNDTLVIDPRNITTKTIFDPDNRPTQIMKAYGTTDEQDTMIGYDPDNNQTSIQIGDKPATVMDYDFGNRLQFEQQADGTQDEIDTTFGYNLDGDQTSVQVGTLQAAVYRCDLDNRDIEGIDASGVDTTMGYDPHGNETSVQVGTLAPSAMIYNGDNELVDSFDPSSVHTHAEYDGEGNQTFVQTGNQPPTLYHYDMDNRLQQTIVAAGTEAEQVTTTFYDANSNVTGTQEGPWPRSWLQYDDLDRVYQSVDPAGLSTNTVHDPDGNVAFSQVGAEPPTVNHFDAQNRLTESTDPSGVVTTNHFDVDGNLQESQVGDLTPTEYRYDGLNRTTLTIDPAGGRLQQHYDSAGRVDYTIDPDGNRTDLRYDDAGKLLRQIDQSGHALVNVYEPLTGRLHSTTDRDGRTRLYQYDDAGRVQTETWSDAAGSVVDVRSYGYDPTTGNLVFAGNANSAYAFGYRGDNRVKDEWGPFGVHLQFGYNSVGDRTLVQDFLGGTEESAYDADHRLRARGYANRNWGTQLRIDLSYNDFTNNQDGSLAGTTRYADVAGTQPIGSSQIGYDPAGRVTGIQHNTADGPLIFAYSYTPPPGRQPNGRLSSETDNGVTVNYSYDDASQLLSDGSSTHSYDGAGNRTDPGYVTPLGGQNRLLTDGTWKHSYDFEGNVIAKVAVDGAQSWSYGYNLDNQMTAAVQYGPDGVTPVVGVQFVYDVFGNRIEKFVTYSDGTTRDLRMAYDIADPSSASAGQSNAWADWDSSTNTTTRRMYGDAVDQLFARTDSTGATAFYLTDHLGSVRAITDSTGSVVDQLGYDSFGSVRFETNWVYGDRFKFTGRDWDAETGLYYYRARYYNPQTGQFSGEDPASADPENAYRYVGNDATMATDPTGLFEWSWNDVLGILSANIRVGAMLVAPGAAPPGATQEFASGVVTAAKGSVNALGKRLEAMGRNAERANGSLGGFLYYQAQEDIANATEQYIQLPETVDRLKRAYIAQPYAIAGEAAFIGAETYALGKLVGRLPGVVSTPPSGRPLPVIEEPVVGDLGPSNEVRLPRMSRQEAIEMGLTERDPQWPWRGLHETEAHHPLMQGAEYRPFWKERGLSSQDVKGFIKDIDKDVHRAISEAAPGKLLWWDEQLLTRIISEEAAQGNTPLSKQRVLGIANELLQEMERWSP